jgi:hypothetical protein
MFLSGEFPDVGAGVGKRTTAAALSVYSSLVLVVVTSAAETAA